MLRGSNETIRGNGSAELTCFGGKWPETKPDFALRPFVYPGGVAGV